MFKSAFVRLGLRSGLMKIPDACMLEVAYVRSGGKYILIQHCVCSGMFTSESTMVHVEYDAIIVFAGFTTKLLGEINIGPY